MVDVARPPGGSLNLNAMRERNPWFFALFDQAPVAMALTRLADGATVDVNEAFQKLLGFSRDEVVGKKTTEDLWFSTGDARARFDAELRDHGKVQEFECVRLTKGGAGLVLQLNVVPLDVERDAHCVTSVRDVTQARAAAAEIVALVDNLPELAWTARPDGFIDFYNRRWYEYTGTTFEDMQGWGWQSVHDSQELPRVMESWTRSIATQKPFDQSFPLRRKDGVYRWFLTRVAPMFDDAGKLIRWVGINTDIDDQRRDQEAAHEAEERFRLVFECSPVGMIKMNADGRIVLVNAQIETLFGYAREDLVGQPIEKLVPRRFEDADPDPRPAFVVDPRRGAKIHGRELHGIRKDGSAFAVEIGLTPLATPDGVAVLSSVVDVSERKRAEQEKVALVKQLRALNADLEERVRCRTSELSQTLHEREALLREKTSLLQEVHHRVKNNLQMISSLLNLQARQIHDKEARTIFLESQGRVRSIALLHESLYQSDDLGRVDMREYVDKLVGTLKRTYGPAGASVRFATSIERVYLPVDLAVPCGLIVNELVTNSLKHAFVDSSEGAHNEIRIEMRRVDDHLTLVVVDNGPGFAAEVDPARDETMGLTLVRDLSLQLRGRAEFVTSNGARCTVRFPAPLPEGEGAS